LEKHALRKISMTSYKELKQEAYAANMEIPARSLAIYTWGNVSAFDHDAGVFAIKPSGVAYDELTPDSMVVVDLKGKTVEGNLKPSSDTKTHLVLYRSFAESGLRGIVHTHSPYAVAWAQSRRDIPVFGTTHADHLTVPIPCTNYLSEQELSGDYELATGELIVQTFAERNLNPVEVQMVLLAGHGPFTWGSNASKAVYNAAVLEEVSKMALATVQLNGWNNTLPDYITRKHWERKHGKDAYYGQS
jgi:L-ribulose-5-phosphate 4-epimerase